MIALMCVLGVCVCVCECVSVCVVVVCVAHGVWVGACVRVCVCTGRAGLCRTCALLRCGDAIWTVPLTHMSCGLCAVVGSQSRAYRCSHAVDA